MSSKEVPSLEKKTACAERNPPMCGWSHVGLRIDPWARADLPLSRHPSVYSTITTPTNSIFLTQTRVNNTQSEEDWEIDCCRADWSTAEFLVLYFDGDQRTKILSHFAHCCLRLHIP
jgi:hypothetical protein